MKCVVVYKSKLKFLDKFFNIEYELQPIGTKKKIKLSIDKNIIELEEGDAVDLEITKLRGF
jgi:hypothetical protein